MEIGSVFIWWLTLLAFGLVGWPLAFTLLGHLPDRGFALARATGLLLVGYILWLGATFRLLQNSTGGVLAAMVIVAAVGLIWRRQQSSQNGSMLTWLKQEWRYALTVEVLFGLAFGAWVFFKAHNPNIETAGGEKWMEIAFINGILRSDYFPPQDPWLSGFGISYYYFGYVMMAALTQLNRLVSTTAFNLYVPTLFALTLTGAFGLVANMVALYRRTKNAEAASGLGQPQPALNLPAVLTGVVGALFVGLMGNLIGVLEVLHKRGLLPAEFWIWLDIRDLKVPPIGPSDSWIPDRFIWWWRGSRVLTDYNLAGREQEVIDEFPFFSFLLGDVHPHVLALPFVLLVTALALNLLANPASIAAKSGQTTSGNALDKLAGGVRELWQTISTATGGRFGFILYAVFVGSLSFLNTWDFPIYLSVVGLTFIIWLARRSSPWQTALLPGVIGTVTLAITGVILYLPFYATFQSQAKGLLPNLWNPTRLPQFFVFFGPFLVAIVVLMLLLSTRNQGWLKSIIWTLPLTIFGPLLLMLVVFSTVLISPAGRGYIEGIINSPDVQAVIGQASIGALVQQSLWRRLLNPWTFLFLSGLLGWAAALTIGWLDSAAKHPGLTPGRDPQLVEKFVLILLLVGLGLPLAVEFIYLRDNFGIRMNTIFKFYFQAWVLLALASAFTIYYVSINLPRLPRLVWQISMLLLVTGAMIYPILAIDNKANNFQEEPTLNGIAWISSQRPNDYAAIQWLRDNAPDNAVILEAPGSGYAAYQYTGRISALTGIPTLLGWGGHQSQWRGNYDEPARREPDIEAIYNTPDPGQAQQLLKKYGVNYVYVGALERERYSPQGLKKFDQMMPVVFQQDEVTIYQFQ
ncbi:MAG: hypothetical protein KDI79_22755 [Anaerolineae bacterium]|nr:hypothetical protein [Anaerolineae bacterium]